MTSTPHNPAQPPLRVLIVDDSAFNRRNIEEILSGADVEIVGKASDGAEALRLVATSQPDVITLDLEMPRMDGFTFLRILMSSRPTPVVIVSSYSQKENVFKALELGALDFVTKPDRYIDLESTELRTELRNKVLIARGLQSTATLTQRFNPANMPLALGRAGPKSSTGAPAKRVVAIAASTGGPSGIMELFSKLPANSGTGIVVAQHMPHKFTRTFSERLDRCSLFHVKEAEDGDLVEENTAFVCPGGKCMELTRTFDGKLALSVVAPRDEDEYVPSASRLLGSVARSVGNAAARGVVLTGMGDDGVAGAKAIIQVGGRVIAESEQTAVVYGMPGAAVRAGAVTEVLTLQEIGEWLGNLRR